MSMKKYSIGYQYGYANGSYEITIDRHILTVNEKQHNFHNDGEAELVLKAIIDYPIMARYLVA